ncbi:MAG: TonB-dependent receptor, partial [Tenuifilaceae bacterium]|nr:TonB-dependent receptor [Tenuifilaceae bacterium]
GARFKEREFNATQFNFRIKQNMIVDPNNLDTYFNQPNLENDFFTIETFRGNQYVPNVLKPQEYGGTQIISGGYLNFEYNVTPKFTALLGVRAESIYQDVRWNTQLDPRDRSDAIEKLGVLPSITTRYEISEKQNLRLAASKTYTLPQFKERALFIYEEVTQVKLGNPDLYASDNYNLDVKWELFPSSGEVISITGYGKYILNPINEVTISSATSDISFLNTGDWGYVAGVEFELRKSIYSGSSTRLNGGVNASYLHTDQMLDSDKISDETNYRVRFTHDKAKFSGASDWLVNADLTLIKDFNDSQSNVMVTLAYNYTSDNIYAIGTNAAGNIVNKAINSLDLVVKSNVNKRFSVSASLKNILDSKVERVQENLNGPITVMSYQMGVLASLKLGYRF